MKLTIRNAVPRDFQTLVAIDQTCFPEGVAYDAWELEHYMSRRDAATLVAESDGRIAGFLLYNISRRGGVATLVTLDVSERYRNSGIGSDLMTRSENLLRDRGVRRYQLQVDTSNSIAVGFYERRGFRILDRLPHYYANGADAYLMEKDLRVEH